MRPADLAAEAREQQEADLPEGWVKVLLKALAVHALGGEWGKGDTASGGPDSVRVNVLRGREFRDWDRERGATAVQRWVKRKSLAKRELRPGDIVVEISGGGSDQPVGRTLLIDEAALRTAEAPLICSNFCRQIRVHSEVDPGFVQLALRYLYFCGGFDEYQTQTTNIRNLNFSAFLGVELPLPPYAEQVRIVERVRELRERAERAREALSRAPAILRRFRQSVLDAAGSGLLTEAWRAERERPPADEASGPLQQAFAARTEAYEAQCRDAVETGVRPPRRPRNLERSPWQVPEPLEPPEIPPAWEMVALRDIALRAQYGTSVRAGARAKGGVPILRMGNIQNGEIDVSDLKYIDPASEDVPAYTVQRGDILFNRTNSPELVGKAAVFDLNLRSVFASYLVRLSCDERLVSSRYVCAWINSPWGRWWARTVRTDCVSQSNINASKLLAMPIPLPPLAEQQEIVRRIDALFRLADAIEVRVAAASASAEKLDRMILAKALRGELVPTEAELAVLEGRVYEPAAALLDRIGADRRNPPIGDRLRRRLRKKADEPQEKDPPRASVLPARPGGTPIPGVGGAALEDFSAERVMAVFRKACWGAAPMDEDELLRRVAYRLGFARLGKKVRSGLADHLRTAVARRIVAPRGPGYIGATPKFGRYDYDFLIVMLRMLMRKGVDYDPQALTRKIAAHLGYGHVTSAIRERMDGVYGAAVRRGILDASDGKVRRRL